MIKIKKPHFIEKYNLEIYDYHFRHNYYRCEKAFKRLQKKGIMYKIELKGEKNSISFKSTRPDEKTTYEFSLSMSIFLLQGSPLYIPTLLNKYKELIKDIEFHNYLDSLIESFNKLKIGILPILINNEKINAEQLFGEVSSNVLHSNDINANSYFNELKKDPLIFEFKWYIFTQYSNKAFEILSRFFNYLKENNIHPPHIDREYRCIFCKSTNHTFKSVEHIYPESIGNEVFILPRGYVCDNCNNIISNLEKEFATYPPFNLLIITNQVIGKKGKFPTTKLSNFHLKKRDPNTIEFLSHSGEKGIPKPIKLSNGTYKFTMSSQKKINQHVIGRVLAKIGLEIILLERGERSVFFKKYDPIRKYIIKGGVFKNYLIMFTETTPSNGFSAGFIDKISDGIMTFNFYGQTYILGLEPNKKIDIKRILDSCLLFDLKEKETKGTTINKQKSI